MKKISLLIGSMVFTAMSCNQPAATDDAEADGMDNPKEEQMEKVEPTFTLTWETDTSLTTNESVLYDKNGNTIYVSNISGQPTEKDGVGFISKLDRDGVVTEKKWAKGLDAPKGMGILEGKLYVTNIDELVEINLADGKITKRYPVEGGQFLNDVAIGNGKVYFSDMKTGKLHVLESEKVSTLKEGMKGLNGLAFAKGKLYGLDESGLVQVGLDGVQSKVLNSEVTGGDGLVVLDENTFIASRWQGEIWLIQEGKATKLLDSKADEIQTADIDYIPEEKLVLVPRFFSNKVSAYKLDY